MVHIWHSECLWCIDDNEGFELPIRLQSSQRSKFSNSAFLAHSSMSFYIFDTEEGSYLPAKNCLWSRTTEMTSESKVKVIKMFKLNLYARNADSSLHYFMFDGGDSYLAD